MTQTRSLQQRLWQIAWPLILTNLTVPLLGLVDTAVLGHLPTPAYLGAVAVGANLFTLLYWTFGFMRMGTTGLAAQALGKHDDFALVALLARTLLMALVIALLLISLQTPLISTGLKLMGGSESLQTLATEYAHIRIWSAPAVLCQYALIGWLIGLQAPRGPLLMLLSANLLNIVLDVWFVMGLGWNSQGVAWATVMAEYVGMSVGFLFTWYQLPVFRKGSQRLWGAWADYRVLIQVNYPIMVRTLLLLLVFAFFTAQGARQGETILAANAVLLTFLLLLSHGLDGFANAAEALIGEAVGANDQPRFWLVCRIAFQWSFWAALLFTVLFWVGGSSLIRLLTSISPVQQVAMTYLPWLWVMPLVAVWSYTLDGIFIGATRTRDMQNAMIFSTVVVFLPVWWLTQGLGNHGLWLALVALMLARVSSMAWLLYRKPLA